MDQTAIDNLGRTITPLIGSIDALRSALGSLKTGDPQAVGGDPKAISDLTGLMSEFIKDFKKSADEEKSLLNEVVNAMKSGKASRSKTKASSGGTGPDSKSAKNSEEIADNQERANNAQTSGYKTGQLMRNLSNELKINYKEHNSLLEKAIQNVVEQNNHQAKITDSQFNGYQITKELNEEQKKLVKAEFDSLLYQRKSTDAAYKFRQQLSDVRSTFDSINSSLGIQTNLTEGLVKEEAQFTRDVRAAAYETAGVTKNSKSLQRVYEDIGTSVRATGVDRTKFQQSYMKALKGGVKDLKQAVSLTTTQLNTEQQLGMEAGSLQDTFQGMAQSGRMTNSQISEVGRGMRDVARNTGLTGEALRGAVDSSREIINQLRNAANLTATATKNVIEMNANAKKLGVESQMQSLQSGLTSGAKLLTESSTETRNAILMAAGKTGKLREAMNGTLLDTKDGIKSLGKGFQGILKDFGVGSLEEIDQLSAEAKTRLNIQLKSVVGMELGEFRSLIESVNEAGKGLGDRLTDINKKMQGNITADEKKNLMEEQRRLKASKQLEMLTALDEAAKGAKDMNGALAKFGEKKKDFEGDLQALGTSWTDSTQVARESIRGALENVNQGLKEAGKSQLKIDSTEIEKALKDPTALRELTAKITKGEQELATAQKAQLDPVTQSNQYLSEINDNMRNLSQNIMSKGMNSIVGQGAVAASVMGSLATQFGQFASSSSETFGDLKGALFGKARVGDKEAEKSIFGNIKTLIFGAGKESGQQPEEAAKTAGQAATTEAAKTAGQAATTEATTTQKPLDAFLAAGLSSKGEVPTSASQKAESAAGKEASDKSGGISGGKYMKVFQDMITSIELMGVCCERTHESIKTAIAALEHIAKCCDLTNNSIQKAIESVKSPSPTATASAAEAKPNAAEDAINKKIQDQQMENAITDANVNKIKIREQKKEVRMLRVDQRLQREEVKESKTKEAESSAGGAATGPPDASVLDPKAMEQGGKSMMKTAASAAVLTAGAVLLGAAIMFLGDKLLKLLNIDVNRMMEIGTALTALVGVTAAVTAASVFVSEKILEFAPKVEEIRKQSGTLIKTALALVLIGSALVLFGAALVGITGKILSMSGLDAASTIEIAANIGALAAVASGVAVATVEFAEVLQEFTESAMYQQLSKNPKEYVMKILKAAAVIGAFSVGIVTFGALLVKAIQGILYVTGIDASVVTGVVDTLWALGWGVGKIVLATAAAVGVIMGLGWAFSLINNPAGWTLLGVGAAAIAVAVPLIAAFSIGVIYAAAAFSNLMDTKTANDVADGIAAIAGSTTRIVGALAGAAASLVGLAGVGVTAFFLSFIIGYATDAVNAIVPVLVDFSNAAVKAAKSIVGVIPPRLVDEATSGMQTVLDGVRKIGSAIVGMIPYLSGMSALGTISGILANILYLAGWAILDLTPPIVFFGTAVIIAAKAIVSIINPKYVQSAVEGVEAVLNAVKTIGTAMKNMSDFLYGFSSNYDFTGWVPMWLYMASDAIITIKNPILYYALVIKNFAKALGAVFSPRLAKGASEGVTAVVDAITDITNSIMKLKETIDKYSTTALYAGVLVWWMNGAIRFFQIIQEPIINFGIAISDFALALNTAFSARLAKSASEGVNAIIGAITEITTSVMEFKKTIDKYSVWAPDWVAWWLRGAVTYMQTIREPIVNFVIEVMGLAQELGNNVKIGPAKLLAKTLTVLSTIIEKTTTVISDLSNKLVPLVRGGWFKKSPAELIKESENKLKSFFKTVSGLVVSIIDEVQTNFKDIGKLKSTAKILMVVGMIITEMAKAVELFSTKIMPFTKKDFATGKSPIEKINESQGQLGKFFENISNLISEGIVAPVSMIGNVETLKPVAKTLAVISVLLNEAAKTIKALADVVGLMDPVSFFQESPISKISKYKNQFAEYFLEIADLVTWGIVWPILFAMPNTEDLRKAQTILIGVATIACATGKTIKSLAEVMALMDPVSLFFDSPMEKIVNNKKQFTDWFDSIAVFVRDGIVDPVVAIFTDTTQLNKAAVIIKAMSLIAIRLVPLIKNLAEAISLATDAPTFFGVAPMQKIVDNKEKFKGWFISIAEFMKTGIIIPVFTNLGDVDMGKAQKIIMAMATIARNISPLIKNMASAVGMVSEGGEESIDTDFPMDKIIASKDKFAKFFNTTAIFLRDGVVMPILQQMGDLKQIQQASRTLLAMNSLLTNIPLVIKNFANNVLPLVVSADTDLRDTPAEKIDAGKEKFAIFFRNVTAFLRDGIVNPVIQEMPDSKTIQTAGRIMLGMNMLLNNVSGVIKNLVKLFGGSLDPNQCLKEAPIPMIARMAPIYQEFFGAVIGFLVDGIANPILHGFPSEDDMKEANGRMKNMLLLITQIPPFIQQLNKTINDLGTNIVGFGTMFSVAVFTGTFGYISNLLIEGVINPIRMMPDSEELDEMLNKLNLMSEVVYTAGVVMSRMNQTFNNFASATNIFSSLTGRWDQHFFQKSFTGMAISLKSGIIEPITNLFPKASELQIVVDKLALLGQVLNKLEEVMNSLGATFSSIGKMGVDMSQINTMPMDKLLALANIAQSGAQAAITPVGAAVANSPAGAAVSTAASGSTNAAIENKVAAKKAGEEPATNKVTSKELQDISKNSSDQNAKLDTLITLFQKVVDALKPSPASGGGGGSVAGETPDTSLNRPPAKSPMFPRAVTGRVGQGPAKQVNTLLPIRL
jgi:hypothetical protein